MDRRLYRHINLPNQMKVLLISDPHCHNATAALSVNVGNFDDSEVKGIAHYCEHMLFLGTEKYQDEKEFGMFIQQHGGENNAHTGADYTTFYFTIGTEAFEEALDRFS